MTFASDRLYNDMIRRNLAVYATVVKVREILPYLPCLTLTDKEEVEAKKDSAGNYAAVQMLLDNLRRRENWPEEFIAALRSCEHTTLADELSNAYDRIRGRTNNAAAAPAQVPASDSTAAAAATPTVTTATIHTVPVTSPPLLTPPSVNVPPQTNAPPSIPAQVPPPASDLQRVEQVKVPAPAAFPEPASQPQIPPPIEVSSQVPLPTVVSASKVASTVQQNEDDRTTTSLSTGNDLSTLGAPASSSDVSVSLTTNSPFQNSEKDQVPLADKKSSENFPVQETNPPLNKEPEECSDPTVNETVQRTNTVGMPIKAMSIRIPQATASPPAEVVTHCLPSVSQEYFSKPGTLRVSDEAVIEQEEPCSTTTSDLEISTPEPVQSVSLEQPSAPLSSMSESSDASNLNQPEEDHYESSFESQLGILTNVIHISEEPSAENLNGQPPSMLGNKFNPYGGSGNLQHSMGISEDQPAQNYESTESMLYLRKTSGRDATRPSDQERSTSINNQAQESNATKLASNPKVEPREEGQTTIQINKLHLTAAAAAAVSIGLFVVWKIKH